jgi:hypothetical protein
MCRKSSCAVLCCTVLCALGVELATNTIHFILKVIITIHRNIMQVYVYRHRYTNTRLLQRGWDRAGSRVEGGGEGRGGVKLCHVMSYDLKDVGE